MVENTYLICIVRARYKEKQPCERILCWIWDLTGFGSYRLENKSQNIHIPKYIVSCKDNPALPTFVSLECQRDKQDVGRQDVLWNHKRNRIPVREPSLAHQNIACSSTVSFCTDSITNVAAPPTQPGPKQ